MQYSCAASEQCVNFVCCCINLAISVLLKSDDHLFFYNLLLFNNNLVSFRFAFLYPSVLVNVA